MSSLPTPVSGVGILIVKKVCELLCLGMWCQEWTRNQTKKQESTIVCLILAGNNDINQEFYNTVTGDLQDEKAPSLKFQKGEGAFCSHYSVNEGGKWLRSYIVYMLILLIFFQQGEIFKELVGFCLSSKEPVYCSFASLTLQCS